MSKIKLSTRHLQLPMRVSFKHASAERKVGDAILVQATDEETTGWGESCPRSYVTGENSLEAIRWIENVNLGEILDVESLKNYVEKNREVIDKSPAAWCAVELALLDFFAKRESKTVEEILSLDPLQSVHRYSAVLSDGDEKTMLKTAALYLERGFDRFKVKISGEAEKDQRVLSQLGDLIQLKTQEKARIRIDANNLWENDVSKAWDYFESLHSYVEAVEEPFSPRDVASAAKLSGDFNLPIILDESFTRYSDFDLWAAADATWIPNIRVSKMGGLLRSLEISAKAKELGWSCVVGAQVGESSILTRAALPVAESLGNSLWAQEGAFGLLLLEKDIAHPPLMFAQAGLLQWKDYPNSESSGWGLSFA